MLRTAVACSARSAGDEAQNPWTYRSHRERSGARQHAVRRQDEHGQSWSAGHDADGEAGPGPGHQFHRTARPQNPREGGLRRLQTDFIELYQVHGWDSNTPLEETLRTLDDLVRQGKVRYVGLSNLMSWQGAPAVMRQGRPGG